MTRRKEVLPPQKKPPSSLRGIASHIDPYFLPRNGHRGWELLVAMGKVTRPKKKKPGYSPEEPPAAPILPSLRPGRVIALALVSIMGL